MPAKPKSAHAVREEADKKISDADARLRVAVAIAEESYARRVAIVRAEIDTKKRVATDERDKLVAAAEAWRDKCLASLASKGPQPSDVVTVFDSGDTDCVVCLSSPKTVMFAQCGHFACCRVCAEQIEATTKTCPVCRKRMRGA